MGCKYNCTILNNVDKSNWYFSAYAGASLTDEPEEQDDIIDIREFRPDTPEPDADVSDGEQDDSSATFQNNRSEPDQAHTNNLDPPLIHEGDSPGSAHTINTVNSPTPAHNTYNPAPACSINNLTATGEASLVVNSPRISAGQLLEPLVSS
jgi:hypothetical protein